MHPLGTRLVVPAPPQDAAAFVIRSLTHGAWRHQVAVRVHTSGDLVREQVAPTVADVADDGHDGDGCLLTFGTDDLDWAARWLLYSNLDFDVLQPPELNDRLRALGRWLVDRY